LSHVREIGSQGEQEEQRAEHVLALRDPGHRLDVQRMQREEGGHERAPEARPRHPLEQAEEQERVHEVNGHARQVVPAGVEAKQLDVELVREPRQRMPVGRMSRGQRPGQGRSVQAARDVTVLADVLRVVEFTNRGGARGVHERPGGDEGGRHERPGGSRAEG
jgi:hypothetical protein